MNTIQELINACQWDTTQFFVLSKNVFDPLIYYSHLLPLSLSLLLGIFVFIKNPKLLTSRILFCITLLFGAWVFCDLVTWATDKPAHTMFFWAVLVTIEPLLYAACLYFVQVFITEKDSGLKSKVIIATLLLPTLIFAPTNLSLAGYDLTNCDRSAVEGPLAQYGYLLEIVFILWILIFAMEQFRGSPDRHARRKIVLVTVGIVLFLLTFSWGNIVGTLSLSTDWRLAQWGLFGMPIFVGFLAYMIVKFKTFNIKVLATQALIWALWIMIGGILLVAKTNATRIVTSITEVIAIVFGIMLIRSVHREVEQREQLARLNSELAGANVQLTDLNRQKSEFLSFASHDLKSPINIIKQFASLIADGTYKEPQKVQETILKIKSTADRATTLVDDFLDLRKIEEGHMDYVFEVKDLVSFAKGITEDYAPLAKAQKNIDITFASTVATAQVKMDTNRLRQVVQNLLSNSLKYTESGAIAVSITEEQPSLLMTVKDSGVGMDKALLPILFAQFRRDPSVAKKIQGTGLGLYISKQIVVAHGGEIWAESEGKGLGSTFYVRLPKA